MAISKITSDAIDATGFNLDSDTLTIDATNNRVGIGTSSPTARMSIEQSGTGDFDSIILSRTTGNVGDAQSVVWQQNDLSNLKAASISGEVTGASAGALTFNTASGGTLSEQLRIDSSGNVGLGTTSPGTKLHIADSTDIDMSNDATGQFRIEGNGYSAAIALNATGMQIYQNSDARQIILGNNETENLRIDTGGSINITGETFGLVTNPGQSGVSLADDASINLALQGAGAAGGGILCVYEPASGDNAIYHVGYNRANVISNSGSSAFTTGDTDGKNCVIVSAHTITFKNRRGSTRSYVFNLFIAGGNAYQQ